MELVVPVILVVVLLAYFAVEQHGDEQFRRRVTELVPECRWHWLDRAAPNEIPGELLAKIPDTANVRRSMTGVLHGEQVALFLFRREWGRQERWYSAVAMLREHPERPLQVSRGDVAGQYRGWVLVTARRPLRGPLTAEQTVELLLSMRSTTDAEAETLQQAKVVPGGVVIHPRRRDDSREMTRY